MVFLFARLCDKDGCDRHTNYIVLEQLSLHTPVCVIHRRRPYSEQKSLSVAAIIKLVETAMTRASNLNHLLYALLNLLQKKRHTFPGGVHIGVGS